MVLCGNRCVSAYSASGTFVSLFFEKGIREKEVIVVGETSATVVLAFAV